MSNTWNQWEGQVVNGKYLLAQYLGGSEHSAVFLTQRRVNDRSVNAAIKIIPCTPEYGEGQLSRWQQSAALSHPHLVPLYESGRFDIGGIPFVYAVMECADENLSQVVPARALTAEEAREILSSLLDVLFYLHANGFVHGGIKPAHILASSDQLKVSSDALYRAGESLDILAKRDAYVAPEISGGNFPLSHPLSPASDLWSLGLTLVEALTQNLPPVQPDDRQDPFIPATLPEPFLDIAKNCLVRNPQNRWTIEQIAARLEGRSPIPPIRTAEIEEELPEPVPQHLLRDRRPPVARNRYVLPFAIGFALVVGAILAGPRPLRRHAEPTQTAAVSEEKNPAPPAAKELAPAADEHANNSSKARYPAEESDTKAPVPTPALAHPGSIRQEATNTVARFPGVSAARGQVTHRVMPEVTQSASKSIRGTVKVRVKVNVDRAGNVEDAELASRGPSRYFARQAQESARLWKFNPPMIGNRGVLSTWILEFDFTRDQTTVVPTQEFPAW